MSLSSCVGTAPTKEVRHIDSLNQVAYTFRYKNLDSSYHAALKAYKEVNLYRQGKAEAVNNLGFCAFMRMDFEKAEKLYKEVYDLTQNELELLVADIGLMKIYQRTAMNKEFYDYRISALSRMKRIDEDNNLFIDKHERQRLNYARSEFYIVSAIYYFYLQQRPEAIASIREIQPEEELAADTSQLLYYHYIKGSASLCDAETKDERRLQEFDELYTTWKLASHGGYLYFEGNGVQGLANLMVSPHDYEFFLDNRLQSLKQFSVPVDSLLPMRFGQLALQTFRKYNDLYQIAGTYVSIGKYLNTHGDYSVALDTLTKALECVNEHHRRYYDCRDSLDWLRPFDRRDTISTEKAWIQRKLKTVPEWILRIREQLTVTYAGLGMKERSDYNRNIYLDILEDTRQDKELESRYQSLENEGRQLNILLLIVVTGFVVVVTFLVIFNKRSRIRNRNHVHRLKQMLDICQKITASIPADAQTEDEIVNAIYAAVHSDIEQLFEGKEFRIENRQLLFAKRINKDERAMVRVITPYITWALDNGMNSISLNDERKRLEKQRYIYEQHIATNKRGNVIKKACLAIVSGIHPYIDRIINEVHKLTDKGFIDDERIKVEKYQYIDELVTTINDYNDILALWIKMKQGSINLNIETFDLNELFNLIRKGSRSFEMKKQTLEVTPTDAYVKADKALTLFMINTLAENARKYTPQGGIVKVYAHATDEYVEISVEDNGCGLSEKDVASIIGEKLYNSKEIGIYDASDQEELRKNKGSGFGLMNCKGIIEKYRKTNEVFRVCLFNAESTLGKGSRFYFRLPKGIRKVLMGWVCICMLWSAGGCRGSVDDSLEQPDYVQVKAAEDSLSVQAENAYETLLDKASDYADDAYYCNVDGEYKMALQYVDSAIICLNAHYKKYARFPHRYMALTGDGEPAELDWWKRLFNSDFHVILDIRNEAAVSFLALKQWEAYSYNNAAYTTLYKLLGEDQSLGEYCRRLEHSTGNKIVSAILLVVLMLVLLVGYYILYFHKRLVNRWNLEQVLEINKQVFSASLVQLPEIENILQQEGDMLKDIPVKIVTDAFDAVNELLMINKLGIAVYNEPVNQLEYTSNSFGEKEFSIDSQEKEPLKDFVQRSFTQQVHLSEGDFEALPLLVDIVDGSRCIGVLYLERRENTEQEADHLLLELIASYVAIVIFNAVVKIATKYRDIEAAHEEAYRASWEDNVLHVQNMVLDNCLSTIKHETIYYPNKIKQLVGKLRSGRLTAGEELETVQAISELIEYYKGIFSILSSCASRQLEEATFRRSVVAVSDLFCVAEKYFRYVGKGLQHAVTFHTEAINEHVVGDFILLRFLLENLIDEALSCPQEGELCLQAKVDGDYIRFLFIDRRREKTREELNQLFYPNLERMSGDRGKLVETEYLVCKQIVRDHDEFSGRRGCRINAEPAEGGGFAVYFTILRK
ncbi:MAG: DUF5113 domain-containing protein [Bacteroides sp.]|jgi:signal transduction histidine kinase|nr:DUF5113 domain-containing protein [Bacteroides sp.]MCI1683043.1 DUF5113 domain-containing protein [Bacteroides sp.]